MKYPYCGKRKLQYYQIILKWRKCIYSLEKKCVKNPDFETLYQKQVKKYIENDHAKKKKKIDKNEMFETSNITNYSLCF